jgi:PAS domain-containing protein
MKGREGGLDVYMRDITGRKQAEAALRESEMRARAQSEELAILMDSVPAAVWIAHDRDATHITGNTHSYKWLHIPYGSEASKSAPEGERPENFRIFKENRELPPQEMPVQRAARGGTNSGILSSISCIRTGR